MVKVKSVVFGETLILALQLPFANCIKIFIQKKKRQNRMATISRQGREIGGFSSLRFGTGELWNTLVCKNVYALYKLLSSLPPTGWFAVAKISDMLKSL